LTVRPRGPATAVAALVAALISAVVALLVGVPLLRLGQVLWRESGGNVGTLLGAGNLAGVFRSTLLLAAAATLAAVPLGTAMALLLRRPEVPWRDFLRLAVLLPVVVPDFVLGYSWTQAYARGGFTDSLLGLHWPGLLGPVGVWLVLVVNAAPLVYLVAAVGLAARAEPDLERAARAAGAGPVTTLLTVTLRLLLPSVAAASVLVFVLTLGTFAIPQVLGAPAGFRTVSTRIYADLSLGGDPALFLDAVLLALLLAAVAAVLVVPADALLGPRLRSARPADPQGSAAPGGRPGLRWAGTVMLTGYLTLSVAVPLAALGLSSITRALGVSPTPANWTLDHYREVLTPRTFAALGRSLGLAVAAASLLVVLGGVLAVLERRRTGRTAASLITLTLVLPGSTLAVGLLITYGRWLAGTLVLILLAYLAKLWAVAHRPIAGALDRLPPDELRAARVSGARALTAVRTVALRPLAPALVGVWSFCLLTALHEVTMSSLLYGPGSETLAVVVLNTEELGRIGPTAALSVLLSLLVLGPAVLLRLVSNRVRIRDAAPAEVPRAG
jgi:iron(III) transport system permease protein